MSSLLRGSQVVFSGTPSIRIAHSGTGKVVLNSRAFLSTHLIPQKVVCRILVFLLADGRKVGGECVTGASQISSYRRCADRATHRTPTQQPVAILAQSFDCCGASANWSRRSMATLVAWQRLVGTPWQRPQSRPSRSRLTQFRTSIRGLTPPAPLRLFWKRRHCILRALV